ncbi:MAG: hypothetical protein GY757_26415 [bacterium]|nr:hypothetical protein [bacterium]
MHNKAVLYLSGGTYHLENILAGEYVKILILGNSKVIIKHRLETGKSAVIDADEGTQLSARDLVFYVNGTNSDTGVLPVDIGIRSLLNANIYAPNGTLRLRARGEAEGSFIARDIMVDFYFKLTYNGGLGL